VTQKLTWNGNILSLIASCFGGIESLISYLWVYLTKNKTCFIYLPTYLPIYLPTYLPTYLIIQQMAAGGFMLGHLCDAHET
jgi:hypothetical protein